MSPGTLEHYLWVTVITYLYRELVRARPLGTSALNLPNKAHPHFTDEEPDLE